MRKNFYKLLSNAKQGLFALALTVFSSAVYSQTTYTFNYTGATQSVAVLAGSYSIQCWGANGGTSNGGKGGYATGTVNVTAPTTLYICVGGIGTASNVTGSGNVTGGWNGGGNGSCNSTYGTSGGGGGGSDVRTTNNTTYANRIIVGGGGGGGSTGTYGFVAGNGGGSSGTNGAAYGSYWIGQAGTQTAGGAGTTESNSVVGAGALGVGGNHSSTAPSSGWTGCGGGGGYYGGSAGGAVHSSGGGGSGYIGGVSSATTAAFGQTGFVTNPVTNGNGLVLIKELCNITLVATGTNSNSAICSGSSVTLTTNAISNYSWSTGATTSSIVVSPTATTLYSLSATSPSACTSSAQLTINVNSGFPVLTIANTASATSGICPTKTVALTASGATTYSWTGGSTTVTNGVVFSPTITSGYTVTGYNACGTSTAATSVSIHPFPTVGAVASTPSLCSGLSLTLTATGNASTYVWSGGVTNGAGFFPGTTNTYVVIGTSALSCTASASTVVTVVTTPSLTPTGSPISICIGKSSTLTATGATNYTWLPGNASTSSIVVSPTAVVNTYTVIKSNANCVDTKTISIFVNQLPNIFGIATPTLVCAGRPSTLAVGGAVTYTWTSPGPPSYTFTGASPVVSPPVTSIYTVAGTDANGCVNTATVLLATDPNPTVSIAVSSSVICKGQTVSMTASGGINYTWTSTSGTVFTASYSDTPTGATLYNVTADNSFSCTTTISQIVLVNPTPTINIAITKTLVCTGGPSTITASGANTYAWDANANNAITAGTVVNPVATTVYTVLGTYTATGCQSTKTIEVKVFTPTVTVTSPTNTCYGGNITLVASGANPNSYNWNTGSGFVNPFQTIAVTPTVFTIYTVSAVSGSNGVNCPSTQTTSIGIFYNPTITAIPQRTLFCRGESLNLYGNGGVSYSWSNSQTGATITVSPNTNTNYTVTGTDANGCVNTGTIQVKVSGCVGINELNASAKNGVSIYPNPNTGAFNISSDADIKLNLINELGQLVRGIHLNATNSYKIDISDLSNGVYFIVGEKDGLQVNQKIIVAK